MELTQEQKNICKDVVEQLSLSQKDRDSLSKIRGFSDEIIDKMRFKSCDESYLLSHSKEFSFLLDGDVRAALTYDKVIIPFFDKNNDVFFFRPHHSFITGYGSHLYVPYPMGPELFRNPDVLVITEGEFKAVASTLMGVPAISVPGISSFVKKKLPTLISLLKEINPKKIVFCFDKEIKDDPKLAKYKSDFTKRYDTEFYAITLALKIKKELSLDDRVKIATLKPEWMVDGKIDIDGFLASGRPHSQYLECIKKAVLPREFQYSLKIPKVHASYLNRRIDAEFYVGPIRRHFKKYFWNKAGDETLLTNFVLKISNNMQTSEEVVRICKLVSDYGESASFNLKAEDMTSRGAFQQTCFALGDFEFYGNDEQLRKLWTYVFQHQQAKEVYELDHYGYVAELNYWVFKNGGYNNETGQFTPVDEEGILWVNDIGYRLPDFGSTGLRPPCVPAPISDKRITIQHVHQHLMEAICDEDAVMDAGSHQFARFVIGWIFACAFIPELKKEIARDGFPFLFIYGRASSGKSTLAGWINAFWGTDNAKGIQVSSTKVGIQNACGRFSCLPIWLDEYRNNDRSADKNDLFRSIYDGASALKGSKIQGKIREYPLRSTLLISGEEYPNDMALNTRCVTIPLFNKHTKISQAFKWLEINKSEFPLLIADVLDNKVEIFKTIVKNFKRFEELFVKNKVVNRIAKNFSIISSVASALLGDDENYDRFIVRWVRDYEKSRNDESSISIFFQDLTNALTNEVFDCTFAKLETIKSTSIHIPEHSGKRALYINFKAAFMMWESYCKKNRTETPMKLDIIVKWMEAVDYVSKKTQRVRICKTQQRSNWIMIDSKDVPSQIKDFAFAVEAKQRSQPVSEDVLGISQGDLIDDTEEEEINEID